MSERPLLECIAVSKTFTTAAGQVRALPATTLTLLPGQSLAIVGPSGSGKSTLLSLLAGLDRPSAGEVCFRGQPYSGLSQAALVRHRRRYVGFVFQTSNLVSGMSVQDNVSLPLWLNGWPRREATRRVDELLGRLSLGELRRRTPNQLSGGEMQRVALARALAHRPALLFADEPTGSLDRANADTVADLLVELAGEGDCATVVATHNPNLADRMETLFDLGQAAKAGG